MALSDMQVFEEYALGTYNEEVGQLVELFNGASRGTLILIPAGHEGDYSSESFWQAIPGLVRRRNAYGTGAVPAVPLTQGVHTTVKVAGGTPPISFTKTQFRWMQKNPEEAGVRMGEQLAKASLQDQLNCAIRVGVAGMSGIGAPSAPGAGDGVVYDGTAGNLSRSALTSGAFLFGDRQSAIRAWITSSKPMEDLYQGNLANAEQLFNIETVSVTQDGLGRVVIHTDSPDLVVAGAPNNYHTLGLVEGAITMEDNGTMDMNEETKNGDENIQSTIQAEWDFQAGMKGISWDKGSGGASPNDAALATAANWDLVASDIKDTAGVLVTTL